MCNKLLDATNKGILDAANQDFLYWDGGVTNSIHIQRFVDAGLVVDAGVIAFVENEPCYLLNNGEDNEIFNPNYNMDTFYDSELGLNLTKQTFCDGVGYSGSTNGAMRRYNGAAQDATTAMMYNQGIVIYWIEATKSDTNSGRRLDVLHSAPNGSGSVILYNQLVFNQEGNRFAFVDNLKLVVPARRRLYFDAFNTITNCQANYLYRRIV